MPRAPQSQRYRWSTAGNARVAAAQCALFTALAITSGYAVLVMPDPSWWWGVIVWTVGALAAGSTWVQLVRGATRARPVLFTSWATPLLICCLAAVGALAVLVTTHSPLALMVMLAALFGAFGAVVRSPR